MSRKEERPIPRFDSTLTAADVEGEWVDPGIDSGLIQRCRRAWGKPFAELTNKELATFLRQNIAIDYVLPIAQKRVADGYDDNTEMFDGELAEKVNETLKRQADI